MDEEGFEYQEIDPAIDPRFAVFWDEQRRMWEKLLALSNSDLRAENYRLKKEIERLKNDNMS